MQRKFAIQNLWSSTPVSLRGLISCGQGTVILDIESGEILFESLKNEKILGCDITKSMDFLVEAVNPIQSKGTSLLFLADKYHIPVEKTIGIGDNYNDASMIKSAGLGVAVGNAETDLKECADYVCKHTNNDFAVADIIQSFGFYKN